VSTLYFTVKSLVPESYMNSVLGSVEPVPVNVIASVKDEAHDTGL